MTTLAELIEQVNAQFLDADLFYGHGTDNPWDEAVALVLYVCDAPDDQAAMALEISDSAVRKALGLAQQRVSSRKPLAYLTGSCQYMGLEFLVDEGVLVPRSPIGYLLHQGLDSWMPHHVGRIADLCCGSGCLGIVAATMFPNAEVVMLDIDDTALSCAQKNVQKHSVHNHKFQEQVHVIQQDVTGDLSGLGQFDLVLFNPPYVNEGDMQQLPMEYKHEPDTALAAGRDGLDIIDQVLPQVPKLLSRDGLFVGEVGESEEAFVQTYPTLPCVWPTLEFGGEGIFLLEAQALSSHTLDTSDIGQN